MKTFFLGPPSDPVLLATETKKRIRGLAQNFKELTGTMFEMILMPPVLFLAMAKHCAMLPKEDLEDLLMANNDLFLDTEIGAVVICRMDPLLTGETLELR